MRKQVHPPHWPTLVHEASHLATNNSFLVDLATWTVSSSALEDHVPCVPSGSLVDSGTVASSLLPSASSSLVPGLSAPPLVLPYLSSMSESSAPSSVPPSLSLVDPTLASPADDSLASLDVLVVPPFPESSSFDHRCVTFCGDDYVLPAPVLPSSEGDWQALSASRSATPSPDNASVALLLVLGLSLHKGDGISLNKGDAAASSSDLGMPAFVNPDVIGLQCLSRPHKPKRLASIFLFFGFLTHAAGLPASLDGSTVAYCVIEYLLDLRRNVDGLLNFVDPVSQVFSSVQDNNIYTFRDAMRQPDSSEFIKAMYKGIQDHHECVHLKIVLRASVGNPKTILAIWSFKRKRLPNGQISCYKTRLCAHGGMQHWGVNYWETFSPIVNWMSVQLILILAIVHDLPARAIDFVLAFPQAKLNVPVFMELPVGTEPDVGAKGKMIIKLKQSLYGLKQASLNWFKMLKEGLEQRGYTSSEVDPCLFMSRDAIVLTYVDDCLILTNDNTTIDRLVQSLKNGEEKFDFTDDGDIKHYLGVEFKRESNGVITLTQEFLIRRVIEAVQLNPDSDKSKETPVICPNVCKDEDRPHCKHKWHYRSVIGMLNYLEKTTRPDIAFAVHQCARFCENPKLSHEGAVHRIIKYLIGTRKKGLVFKPDQILGSNVMQMLIFPGTGCSWILITRQVSSLERDT